MVKEVRKNMHTLTSGSWTAPTVAAENRRAQEEIAMRKLQYGESLDGHETESNKDIRNHVNSDDTGSE